MAGTRYAFAIILRENDIFVGEIGLHVDHHGPRAQIGYWVAEPFWNKGIATEAVTLICRFGFDKLQLNTIYGECDADSHPSRRVLATAGFRMHDTDAAVVKYTVENRR